ncbi:tetratricopeptide repeat protein, partial [Chitiniphilus eburneus]
MRSTHPRYVPAAVASGALAIALALLAGCATPPQQTAATPAAISPVGQEKTYLELIDGLMKQGAYHAALAHLDGFERDYGPRDGTRLLRADAERLTGEREAAATHYEALLNSPYRASALHGLALIAAPTDPARAIALLDDATRADPTRASLWNDLGFLALQQADWPRAARALGRAAELAPDQPRYQANLALYRELVGQPQAADLPPDVLARIQR